MPKQGLLTEYIEDLYEDGVYEDAVAPEEEEPTPLVAREDVDSFAKMSKRWQLIRLSHFIQVDLQPVFVGFPQGEWQLIQDYNRLIELLSSDLKAVS